MSFGNQYNPNHGSPYGGSATTMSPVATLDESTRTTFLIKVYQHLLFALVLFVMFETLLFTLGAAEAMYNFLASGGGMTWLLIMGGFMVVSWFATQAAHDILNPSRQYLGLFAIAAGEAVIFAPLLYLAFNGPYGGGGDVYIAAAITGMGFLGLTAVALTTRKDLSFIRPILMWGFMAALVLIVASAIFGWNLGVWFSVAMIALAGGAILYQTQTIMRKYPSEAYVGAAVQLFAAVMLMFWYVLRLVMQLSR